MFQLKIRVLLRHL